MTLKYLLYAGIFCIISATAYSQVPAYEITYDAAGNRFKREFKSSIFLRKGVDKEDEVKQEVPEHQISVFPNPAKSYFDVKISNINKDSKTAISLIDLTGRSVYTKEGIGELTTVDVSNQSNGTYFLQITIDGHRTDWKVIKED